MLNIFIENFNTFLVICFISVIFFCLIQYYYDKNIKYLYVLFLFTIGLFIYYIYNDYIISFINNLYNKHNIEFNNLSIVHSINNKYNDVISLLNLNVLLHYCTLYLIFCLMILVLSNQVVNKNWKLILIKGILGDNLHKIILKGLKVTSKSNNIFIFLSSISIIISCIGTLSVSIFILNNIELISQIIQEYKNK
jgi:hypothetical protein